jgi:hypothetical protein
VSVEEDSDTFDFRESAENAALTLTEMRAAKKLLLRALQW